MNNTPFLFALVLLIVLTASGESRAAQLFINELFHNDNFPETYTKPIPREEKPMLKPTKDRPKIALTSVSYTHLDVYKRQPKGNSWFFPGIRL